MSRTWRDKKNVDTAETAGISETYTIGEHQANRIFLNRVPKTSPAPTISGFTITTGSPAALEFKVDYDGDMAGLIEFNAADNGKVVTVVYTGLDSNVFADFINDLQKYKADAEDMPDFAGGPVGMLRDTINKANITGLVV